MPKAGELMSEEHKAKMRVGVQRRKEERDRLKAEALAGPSLSDVMAAIVNLGARVDAVEQKATPSPFVPMAPAEQPYRPAEPPGLPPPVDAWGGLGDGQERQVAGPLDWHTPTQTVASRGPRFAAGQKVRLVREAQHGSVAVKRVRKKEEDGTSAVDDEGRPIFEREMIPLTWGQVLDKQPKLRCQTELAKGKRCGTAFAVGAPCPACGQGPEVKKVVWETKYGHWKYKVSVPGLTQRFGEGVFEYEIAAV